MVSAVSKFLATLAIVGGLTAGYLASVGKLVIPSNWNHIVSAAPVQVEANDWVKQTGDYHRAMATRIRAHEFKAPADLQATLKGAGKTAHDATIAHSTDPMSSAMQGNPADWEAAAATACEQIATNCGR